MASDKPISYSTSKARPRPIRPWMTWKPWRHMSDAKAHTIESQQLHTSILPPPSEPPRSLTAASAKIWKKVQFWAALFASDAKTMVLAFEVITNQQSYTYWTIFIFFIFGVLCSLSKYSLIAHKLERPRSSRGEQPLVACFIVRIVVVVWILIWKKKINSRSNQLSY